jgi:hypothetical protein
MNLYQDSPSCTVPRSTAIQKAGHSDERKVLRIIILDEDMIHWTPGGLQGRVLIVKEIAAFGLLRN